MYKKVCVICFVFILSFQCVDCQKIVRDVKQIKGCFKQLDLKFINQRGFEKSRDLFFQHVNLSCIVGDTLIIVEDFTDENCNYSSSIYSSADSTIRCFNINNIYSRNRVVYDLEETTSCGMSPYIVNSIQNGSLKIFLKLGVKPRFLPNALLIITVAKRIKKGYFVEVYKTNDFKID